MALGRLSTLKWKTGELSTTYDNDFIDDLETATSTFETFCKRYLRLAYYEEYYNTKGETKLYLENYPLQMDSTMSRVIPDKLSIYQFMADQYWVVADTTIPEFTISTKVYLTDRIFMGQRVLETNWLTATNAKWYNKAGTDNQSCVFKFMWVVDNYKLTTPKTIPNPEEYTKCITDETGLNLSTATAYICFNNDDKKRYLMTHDPKDFTFLDPDLIATQIIHFNFLSVNAIDANGDELLYENKDKFGFNVWLPFGNFVFTEKDKGYVMPRAEKYPFEFVIDGVTIATTAYSVIKDLACIVYESKFPTEEYKVQVKYWAGFDDSNFDTIARGAVVVYPQAIENAIIEHAMQLVLETKGNAVGEGLYRIHKMQGLSFSINDFSDAYRDAVAAYTRR